MTGSRTALTCILIYTRMFNIAIEGFYWKSNAKSPVQYIIAMNKY